MKKSEGKKITSVGNSATAKDVKKVEPKKSSHFWKILGGVILVVVAGVGLFFYSVHRRLEQRRLMFQAQQQIMIDHWKAEGLTDEQIQEKLEIGGPRNFDQRQQSLFGSMMRTVRFSLSGGRGRGAGPGNGPVEINR